jgi:hypothetical protein
VKDRVWTTLQTGKRYERAAMKSMPGEMDFAIEVFARGAQRRQEPHIPIRSKPRRAIVGDRDAPRNNPRDYRKEDSIAFDAEAREVDRPVAPRDQAYTFASPEGARQHRGRRDWQPVWRPLMSNSRPCYRARSANRSARRFNCQACASAEALSHVGFWLRSVGIGADRSIVAILR